VSENKRKHHYVWRRYLGAWSLDDKIWASRSGSIIRTNLMNVGQERDFYKLRSLTPTDVHWLTTLLSQQAPHLREGSSQLLSLFRMACSVAELVPPPGIDADAFRAEQRKVLHNTEEELFSRTETAGDALLGRLLEGDDSVLKTHRLEFLLFACSQQFRTKRQTRRVKAVLGPALAPFGVDAENCWPVLRHAFSDATAISLDADPGVTLRLLKNSTGIPFITSDQPVINLQADPSPSMTPPKHVELYYPISPTLAVVVADTRTSVPDALESGDVLRLNRSMTTHSDEWLFAESKASLAGSANNAG